MKISVLALFRDSEKHIHNTLSSLEELCKLGDFDFYFYENDSIDNTKPILDEWLADKNGQILSEHINAPKFGSVPNIERLILLSYYRNKVKSLLYNSASEYTLLIDTDIIFTTQDFIDLYDFLEKQQNTSMVVSNTRQYQIKDLMNEQTDDSFYDVFALRDRYNNSGLYFTDCPFVLNEDRIKWVNNKPILIKSGFSGFCLSRTNILKKQDCIWSTCGHSEHINFCYSMSKYGNIVMLPYCKPKTEVDISNVNVESCKNIAQQQKKVISNINNIYNTSISSNIQIK